MGVGTIRRAAAGAALLGSMAAFAGTAPASAFESGCPDWGDGQNAYPYANYDLPECRLAVDATRDYGTQALRTEGTHINMRRDLGMLERNRDAKGNRVRWPMVDSFGRTLAYLEFRKNRWETEHPETGRTIYRDYVLDDDQFTVQGRGCMVSDVLESQYALVAFSANDRSTIPAGASIVPYQIRAFIHRDALPETNAAGQPIRGAIDDYVAGCGASDLTPAAPVALPDTDYDSNAHQFYGEDGRARTYATYNVKHLYQNARYFLINTTGTHGGGIVRGVVQPPDVVGQVDGFGYCDPNGITASPVATWTQARVGATRMYGFLPRRCSA